MNQVALLEAAMPESCALIQRYAPCLARALVDSRQVHESIGNTAAKHWIMVLKKFGAIDSRSRILLPSGVNVDREELVAKPGRSGNSANGSDRGTPPTATERAGPR